MEEKIDNVLNKFREANPVSIPVPGSSIVESSTSTETVKKANPKKGTSGSSEVVCKDGVCYKKPLEKSEELVKKVEEPAKKVEEPVKVVEAPKVSAEPVKSPEKPAESVVTPADPPKTPEEDKIKRAMQLIEQKRKEKADQEAREEKEREIRRRKEGQQLIDLKKWQEDQEMKEVLENREKEKREAKAARQRVLEQIAQDKEERAAKFGQIPVEPKTETPSANLNKPTTTADTARIQFKKPDGSNETHSFKSSQTYSELHLFVQNTVLAKSNITEFKLATTFPRREFTAEDNSKTLLELGLIPSSVLLIIPTKKSFKAGPSNLLPTQTSGVVSMLQSVVMGLISPVFALFNYIKNILSGAGNRRNDEENPNEAGKRKRDEETLSANDA